jgi:hypothetical protein
MFTAARTWQAASRCPAQDPPRAPASRCPRCGRSGARHERADVLRLSLTTRPASCAPSQPVLRPAARAEARHSSGQFSRKNSASSSPGSAASRPRASAAVLHVGHEGGDEGWTGHAHSKRFVQVSCRPAARAVLELKEQGGRAQLIADLELRPPQGSAAAAAAWYPGLARHRVGGPMGNETWSRPSGTIRSAWFAGRTQPATMTTVTIHTRTRRPFLLADRQAIFMILQGGMRHSSRLAQYDRRPGTLCTGTPRASTSRPGEPSQFEPLADDRTSTDLHRHCSSRRDSHQLHARDHLDRDHGSTNPRRRQPRLEVFQPGDGVLRCELS